MPTPRRHTWLSISVVVSLSAFAADAPKGFARTPDQVLCLPKTEAGMELPEFVWTGSQFVVTWYERSSVAPPPRKPPPVRQEPPPDPAARLKPGTPDTPPPELPSPMRLPDFPPKRSNLAAPPPGPPPVPVSFEQKLALMTPKGEVVPGSRRDLTPVDGFTSCMGRLAFTGTELGLVYVDDGSGQRTTMFRKLDAKGVPLASPFELAQGLLPHLDHDAIAWNPVTESWGAVFGGTLSEGPGRVSHHLFLSTFRGSSTAAPVRLDEEESCDLPGPNAAVVASGQCFVTTWAGYPARRVTLGQVCASGEVRRAELTEAPGVQPMQATLAMMGSKVLVAWVDDAKPNTNAGGELFFATATVEKSGLVVGAHGRLTRPGSAQSPHVLADGVSFWVTWAEAGKLWLAHLSPEGKLLEPEQAVGPKRNEPSWSRLTSAGTKLYVTIASPNAPECPNALVEVGSSR